MKQDIDQGGGLQDLVGSILEELVRLHQAAEVAGSSPLASLTFRLEGPKVVELARVNQAAEIAGLSPLACLILCLEGPVIDELAKVDWVAETPLASSS